MDNILYNLIILFSIASNTIILVILIIINAHKSLKGLAFWKHLIIYIPTYIICVIMYCIVPDSYGGIVLPAKIIAPILPFVYVVIGRILFAKWANDDKKRNMKNEKGN